MEKWKLIESKPIFESKWLVLSEKTYQLPNGAVRDKYYHLDKHNYVLIIAQKEDKIAVVRQYRRGVDEILYEFPAGFIEKEENPISAAERELREETGLIGKGKYLGELIAQPGFSSVRAYVILVSVEEIGESKFDEDENIELSFYTCNDIKRMIKEQKILDMGFNAAFSIYLINSEL